MAVGAVYTILREFPGWKGAKLLVALAQGTPLLLVVRADLAAKQGDFSAIKGMRLSAAEGPVEALKQIASRAGILPGRDFEILVDLPETRGRDVSFGVISARARAIEFCELGVKKIAQHVRAAGGRFAQFR